jgi:tRNA U34 5-methylaminomethyl-2-thiouridine-forming methyltransferase MnmC
MTQGNDIAMLVRSEIARLEQGLPELLAEREELLKNVEKSTVQIHRVEGGLMELRGILNEAEQRAKATVTPEVDVQALADAHAAAIFADAGILTEKA